MASGLAHGLAKRVQTLGKQKLYAALDSHSNDQQPAAPPQAEAPTPPALPEAPASCNVYGEMSGRKVQVTLRDSDEQRLLVRLEALLTRFPAEDASEQEPPEGWCSKHDVQMTRHSNQKGSWWSHKTAEGWGHGK